MRFPFSLALLLMALLAAAQPREENPVAFLVAPMDTIFASAGDTVLAQVPLRMTPGYHVNANPPASEDYIPLEVKFDSSKTVLPLAPRYPKGRAFRLEDATDDLLVYDGNVVVEVPLVVDTKSQTGMHAIRGRVEFQACDDRMCFFPDERPLRIVLYVR